MHTPLRMCISCRQMKPLCELMRVVRDNETGEIKPDMNKKMFGRGAYVCKNSECISRAAKKNGFARHLKCAVPKEIYDVLNQSLREAEKG